METSMLGDTSKAEIHVTIQVEADCCTTSSKPLYLSDISTDGLELQVGEM